MRARVLTALGILGLSVACGEVAPEGPCGSSAAVQLPAAVSLSPDQVQPGAEVQVTVSVVAPSSPHLTLQLDDLESDLDLSAEGDRFVARATVLAPAALGDHSLLIRGWLRHQDGCQSVEGGATLSTMTQGACPNGEVRETGACAPLIEGSPLHRESWAMFGTGERVMAHPRELLLNEGAMLACNTDSIALYRSEALGQGQLPSSPEPGELSEAFMAEAGLAACENLAWDRTHGIAVATSRGGWTLEGTFSGALSTWQLPDLEDIGVGSITHLDTHLDSAGIEDAVLSGDGRVYAAGKPNRLLVFGVNEDGLIELRHEQTVPGLRSAWSLAVSQGHLYLSDAGGPPLSDAERHGTSEGGSSETNPGHLFVFDLSDPETPELISWVDTAGPARGLAPLPDSVVAVAVGPAGVELIDVAAGNEPRSIALFNTPGTALDVAYDSGYLAVADWDSLRLFDASTAGVLYFLGASDLASMPATPSAFNLWQGLFGASFIQLKEGRFIVSEFDRTISGSVRPGHRGARLDVPSRWIRVPASGEDSTTVQLELRNGGRDTLVLGMAIVNEEDAWPTAPTLGVGATPLVLGPGERRVVPLVLDSPLASSPPRYVRFETNTPDSSLRLTPVEVIEGNYALGDTTPDFALPVINVCEEGVCTVQPGCFESSDVHRPMVLAFFSSW
jgi:hypothetical protein